MDNQDCYEDLLKDLGSVGDLRWCLAAHGPTCNSANTDSNGIKQEVLRSERLRDVILRLLARTQPMLDSHTEEELFSEARKILDEMGHHYNIRYVRLMGFFLIKAVRSMFEHIWVNAEIFQELQPSFNVVDVPVVLMPTHRSYVDFLLVSFVAFHYGLPLPVIAAGIDFMGMIGIGELLRKSGAFFIRRSFADDPLYRAVFSEYIQTILNHNQPMEFFVEGTRSRSGKSLYPKFGLLQNILEAFLRGSVTDVKIIPISITYERTLEEELYARELLGIPKPRESTSGLLRARRVLQNNFGSIYFHVGKPLSVREFVGTQLDRSVHNLIPRYRFVHTSSELSVARDLAISVIQEQRKGIFVHPWTIMSTVLLEQLRRNDRVFSVNDIVNSCNKLIYLLNQNQNACSTVVKFDEASIGRCVRIHSRVIRFNLEQTEIEFQPEYKNNRKMLHMVLAYYRNQMIHRIAPTAFRQLISRSCRSQPDSISFLQQLYAREFVLPIDEFYSDEFGNELDVLGQSILEPFLVSYSFILNILQSDAFVAKTTFRTTKEMSLMVQQALSKLMDAGVYGSFEILSYDLMVNCIETLRSFSAVQARDGYFVLNRHRITDLIFQINAFLPVDLVLVIGESVERNFGNGPTSARI